MRYLLLVLLAMPVEAQIIPVLCQPAPETIHLLEAIPPLADISIPYEQRVGALRELARKYPDDFFVQRAYQDSFRHKRWLADEYDRALALYRARPSDPLSRYYEARLLLFAEPQRAQETFNDLIKANPKFPWPHADLAEYVMVPGMREKADEAAHRAAFEKTCPAPAPGDLAASAWFATYVYGVPDANIWASMWQSEEQSGVAPDILADRVRVDLKHIEGRPFHADPGLHDVYEEAARLLKDPSIYETFRAKVEREAPDSMLALSFAQNDWEKTHPTPDRNAHDAWAQREKEELQANREWLRRWPNSGFLLTRLVSELGRDEHSDTFTLTPADLALIDQAMRVHALSPDGSEMYPPLETVVADLDASAKVRLDRVPALLDAGMKAIEKMNKYEISADLVPEEMRPERTRWQTITAERTEGIRVDYLLATNRPEDARPLIQQAIAKLASTPATPDTLFDRSQWQSRLARIDPDAAAHLKQGTFSDPPSEFTKPLPEFSAADLAGRLWHLGDLHGKATFVNFWATWCGPCRGEHGGIQELYQRIKSRTDIQVLTFSVDDDCAAARDYMKKEGYTFPVICGKELADRLFPYSGLPTNFLVNPQGVRTGMRGFVPDSASVTNLIDELGKIIKF